MVGNIKEKGINMNCIYSMSIGEKNEKLSSITFDTIKKYANKINADFVVNREYNKNFLSQNLQKFFIYNLLDKYDRVLYIDSDMIIRYDCPNLFDIVPEDKLGMWNEGKYFTKELSLSKFEEIKNVAKLYKTKVYRNSKFYNAGLMVISKIHKNLFELPKHVEKLHCDQPYLNYKIIVDKINMFDISNDFNRFENGSWLNESYYNVVKRRNKLNSYIIHYAGYVGIDKNINQIIKDIESWDNLQIINNKLENEK